MEGRKLQLAGGSTYLVSLPKRWVQTAGLKAGDTVFLETETDGSVSVRARAFDVPEMRRKVFEDSNDGSRDHLLRKLLGAYVSGFGLIEVRFLPGDASFTRQVVREFCHLVIGPEVIEENRNSIVIQDLSDPSDLSVDKCLRRMQLTVRAMLEDAVNSLARSDLALARDVDLRGQDVDRLYWMVAKQYHLVQFHPQQLVPNGSAYPVTGYLLIAKLLEGIGEHAERIARAFPALAEGKTVEPTLAKELEQARGSVIAILDSAFNALVTKNIAMANEAIDARRAHQTLLDALSHRMATRRGEGLLVLGEVVNSLGRAAGYAAEIAEQAIDIAVMTDGTSA
ncbi:MAG TPA: phosphate uptake regulator PhoU [Thermoplasmata archaeon]|nr:phosphate uptake regulator PhoU [Thermoplasmata archaeon]